MTKRIMMNEVVKILVQRDNISVEEAKEQVAECREALLRGEVDAIQYYLGLEDDYIFDILG